MNEKFLCCEAARSHNCLKLFHVRGSKNKERFQLALSFLCQVSFLFVPRAHAAAAAAE
jgi:hypothetical protein